MLTKDAINLEKCLPGHETGMTGYLTTNVEMVHVSCVCVPECPGNPDYSPAYVDY